VCVCFTGTPDNSVKNGFEPKILERLGLKMFSVYGDRDVEIKLPLDDFVKDEGEARGYCLERLKLGPVLLFVDDSSTVSNWDGCSPVIINKETPPS
jgi:hypothetical protein